MPRKNAIVTAVRSDDGKSYVFSAGDQSFTLDLTALSEDVNTKAREYGLVHKITLGAAIAKADLPSDAGEAAAAKFAGMKAVADRIVAGEWAKRGEGNGQPTGVIFRAYEEWVQSQAQKKGVEVPTTEKLRAVYDAKSRADQLALRNVPAIAKIIERIKSEGGSEKAKPVDTANLLDEVFA